MLIKFNHHLKLKGLKQNSISNYFRTIRAIYNKAIKFKIVDRSHYPFHDLTIKSEHTPKLAISRDEIKRLSLVELEKHSTIWRSQQYFMLSFYLRGISFTDLAYLKSSNIRDGRIHYKRRKTHKNYSIKMFDPAIKIINALQPNNSTYLIPVMNESILEDTLDAKRVIKQFIKTTNKYLKRLSQEIECTSNIKTGTSRHTFATLAKHYGYSYDLIAEALGHTSLSNRTTTIYLDVFDTTKVDAMHFEVICLGEARK